MMPFEKEFNEIINEIIKVNKEMTQSELAAKCVVSSTAVMKWLNNGKVDMENLKKICIATDRSPNEIMGFVDEQTFTKDEQDLIIKFRKLPKDIQEIVINIINK